MSQIPMTDRFLTRKGLHYSLIDTAAEISSFRAALERGLSSEDSPFPNYPAYVSAEGKLPDRTPVLVLDAGGTNLRIALVHFEDGLPVVDASEKHPMPGSQSSVTLQEYLDTMVGYLKDYADKADYLGFCFSYPSEILPNRDGRLTAFNKQVVVVGSEGMEVCRLLEEALGKAGLKSDHHCVLINDTVAALLGGLMQDKDGAGEGGIGFILGTGTNTCYIEDAAAIRRYGVSQSSGSMIVNMESGGYDGFPRSEFDIAVDAASTTPGFHLYEKMLSGVYQGELLTRIVDYAINNLKLFSGPAGARLSELGMLQMADIDAFMRDPRGSNLLADILYTNSDRCVMQILIDRIGERAARMAYVNLAAVLEHRDWGRTPEKPARIVAEGSGVWSSCMFLPKLEQYFRDCPGMSRQRYVRIIRADNANLVGAAAAALLN